jgi:hypothetical protein
VSGEASFRQAAWTYLAYGLIYWLSALYLQLRVFEVRPAVLLFWFVLGAVIALGVPWLLIRRRPWFERWVLSRRDFARLLAVLVFARAAAIGWLALGGSQSLRMPRLGGGVPPSPASAWAMAAVALAAGVMLARAGWAAGAGPDE